MWCPSHGLSDGEDRTLSWPLLVTTLTVSTPYMSYSAQDNRSPQFLEHCLLYWLWHWQCRAQYTDKVMPITFDKSLLFSTVEICADITSHRMYIEATHHISHVMTSLVVTFSGRAAQAHCTLVRILRHWKCWLSLLVLVYKSSYYYTPGRTQDMTNVVPITWSM